MQSNFEFLASPWWSMAELCKSAEKHVHDDPQACIMELGSFAEEVTKHILESEGMRDPLNQMNRIETLKQAGVLPYEIIDILHSIRMDRNEAVHQNTKFSEYHAEDRLKDAFILAQWFMGYYGYDVHPGPFIPPHKEPNFERRAYAAQPASKPVYKPAPASIPVHYTPSFQEMPKSPPKEKHSYAVLWLAILLSVSILLNILQFVLYHFF